MFLLSVGLSAAATLLAAPAVAAASSGCNCTKLAVRECVAGKPTAASYKWDFKGETNSIFSQIQSDAQQLTSDTSRLDALVRNPDIDWQIEAGRLRDIKNEVNDVSAKLCRLETIRRVVAPWQQAEIDRIAKTVRLMADNTQDAILFGNAHQNDLWLANYKKYTNNLYDESQALDHSVGEAVAYNHTAKEYGKLRRELASPSS